AAGRGERKRAAIVRRGLRQRERRRQQPTVGSGGRLWGGDIEGGRRQRRLWALEEEDRMGAAVVEEGATAVDAGVAATVWLKHGCAPTGWGCRRQMGAAATMTEARMHCGSRKRRRRYYAPAGKEWAATAKQRRQRGRVAGSGQRRVAPAWEMAGMAGSDEEEGRNYGGRQRKRQPRERATNATVAGSSEEGRLEAAAAASGGQRQMREERKTTTEGVQLLRQ
ncbi:hypothetical protein GW17_00055897, partial [Ensete ventricosum]